MQIINSDDPNLIEITTKILAHGGLIVFPTETCYGLGVDATNSAAVDKLLAFKTRREGKAISVMVPDQSTAERYVSLNDQARHLYKNFLPGPITVISKLLTDSKIDPRVASETHTLGIRIPDHPITSRLTKEFTKPITATSANVSYNPNPYSLEQWQSQTPKKSQDLVDLFIHAGPLPQRPSSTVIDTTTDSLSVLRQGTIQIDDPSLEFTTTSETDTHSKAANFIQSHLQTIKNTGLIIALSGDLGAGKTQFTKGIATALGITENISSPTFTLLEEYSLPTSSYSLLDTGTPNIQSSAVPNLIGDPFLYHIDTWRMESPTEFLDLNPQKLFQPGNLTIIEWADKVIDQINQTKGNTPLILITIQVIDTTTRHWKIDTPKI